ELAAGGLSTEGLPAALFALAEPEPVRLDGRPPVDHSTPPPGRLVPPAQPPLEHAPRMPLLPGGRAAIGSAVATAVRLLRGVRLRVWGTAAVSLGLLAAALVLLPGRGAVGAPEPRTTVGATATAPMPAATAT